MAVESRHVGGAVGVRHVGAEVQSRHVGAEVEMPHVVLAGRANVKTSRDDGEAKMASLAVLGPEEKPRGAWRGARVTAAARRPMAQVVAVCPP